MKRTLGFAAALTLVALAPGATAQQAQPAPAAPDYGMYGIKIAVKDFQKTIAFYTLVGMKQGPKHNAAEWELDWPNPTAGSRIIMVHDETGKIKMAAPGGSMMMISVPSVKATADKLRAAGYPDIGEPRANGPYKILMLKDPDGNQIEMLGG